MGLEVPTNHNWINYSKPHLSNSPVLVLTIPRLNKSLIFDVGVRRHTMHALFKRHGTHFFWYSDLPIRSVVHVVGTANKRNIDFNESHILIYVSNLLIKLSVGLFMSIFGGAVIL